MGYAEIIEHVSQAKLGTIRTNIRMDLANTFSEVTPCGNHRWPGRLALLLQRAISVSRAVISLGSL